MQVLKLTLHELLLLLPVEIGENNRKLLFITSIQKNLTNLLQMVERIGTWNSEPVGPVKLFLPIFELRFLQTLVKVKEYFFWQ